MDYSGRFSYFFRKYSLIRVLCSLAVIALVVTAVFLIGFKNRPVPEIQEIPPSGEDNDQQQRKPAEAQCLPPGFRFWIDER